MKPDMLIVLKEKTKIYSLWLVKAVKRPIVHLYLHGQWKDL